MKVEGKAALVTGGSQGLGKGIVKILLHHGAKVLFVDINQEQGQTTLSEFQKDYGQDNVIFFKGDVTSATDMQDSFKKVKDTFGRLDIVVSNAGVSGETDASWERVIHINLTGTIRTTRLALNYLRKDRGGEGGVIINISSVAAQMNMYCAALKPIPIMPVYAATKSGVVMFSRTIAADQAIRENGVRVNVLCPSLIDTALSSDCKQLSQEFTHLTEQVGLMSVDYVTECFYELVADNSKHGAILTVDKSKGKTYVSLDVTSL